MAESENLQVRSYLDSREVRIYKWMIAAGLVLAISSSLALIALVWIKLF